MAVTRSAGLRTYGLTSGYKSAFDTTGRIAVFTGTKPATADTAISGNTLLGTLTLSTTAFGTPASGAMALATVTSDTSADASGTATWCRFYLTGDSTSGTGTGGATDRRMDLAIGSDISIDNSAIVAGGTIALSGWTLTEAA